MWASGNSLKEWWGEHLWNGESDWPSPWGMHLLRLHVLVFKPTVGHRYRQQVCQTHLWPSPPVPQWSLAALFSYYDGCNFFRMKEEARPWLGRSVVNVQPRQLLSGNTWQLFRPHIAVWLFPPIEWGSESPLTSRNGCVDEIGKSEDCMLQANNAWCVVIV